MRTMKRVVAACLVVVMGVQTTGCHTWRAVTEPVPAAVAKYPNRKIQVTRLGGRTLTADSARVAADALLVFNRGGRVSVVNEQGNVVQSYVRLSDSLPLAEIQALEVRLPSKGRTIALVAAIVIPVAAFVGFAIGCSGGGCAPGW